MQRVLFSLYIVFKSLTLKTSHKQFASMMLFPVNDITSGQRHHFLLHENIGPRSKNSAIQNVLSDNPKKPADTFDMPAASVD